MNKALIFMKTLLSSSSVVSLTSHVLAEFRATRVFRPLSLFSPKLGTKRLFLFWSISHISYLKYSHKKLRVFTACIPLCHILTLPYIFLTDCSRLFSHASLQIKLNGTYCNQLFILFVYWYTVFEFKSTYMRVLQLFSDRIKESLNEIYLMTNV